MRKPLKLQYLDTGTTMQNWYPTQGQIPCLTCYASHEAGKKQMTKLIAMLLIGAAVSGAAFGALTPEIDVNSGLGALTLLSGAVLVLRSRYRK